MRHSPPFFVFPFFYYCTHHAHIDVRAPVGYSYYTAYHISSLNHYDKANLRCSQPNQSSFCIRVTKSIMALQVVFGKFRVAVGWAARPTWDKHIRIRSEGLPVDIYCTHRLYTCVWNVYPIVPPLGRKIKPEHPR